MLGFALRNPYRRKSLIFVGWVEGRNPTFSVGLNQTYPKSGFSVQTLAKFKARFFPEAVTTLYPSRSRKALMRIRTCLSSSTNNIKFLGLILLAAEI